MQVKKIIAVLLTVCLLFSLSVPAYAVDEVYTVSDDTTALSAPIFYTPDYYPGVVAEMRNAGMFANRIAHGSFSAYNYNPVYYYRVGSVHTSFTEFTGDFNSLSPFVTADQTDVSGIYMVDKTTLLSGNMLIFYLPSTSDSYFDFQSSNFVFDQQSPQANTFYIDGDLTFSLRNLWSFTGSYQNTSFYLASDPIAVQLLIDGKAYGDIIDVTGYTSPFTALYNGGLPTNATVTFDNMKIYYQGDTPDMIGFRVYTGSSFTDGQYNYNNAGDFVGVDVENSITLRFSEIPDITFVQEGGEGYAGDLSGISGLLSSIFDKLSQIFNVDSSGFSLVNSYLANLLQYYPGWDNLKPDGSVGLYGDQTFLGFFNGAFLGLRSLMVDSSGVSWLQNLDYVVGIINARIAVPSGNYVMVSDGSLYQLPFMMSVADLLNNGFLGFRSIVIQGQQYFSNAVFPWQSYNMQTHQLNTATSITGQNNLFFTAFQSIEDKLGRLAYVFGSDEDLALKDSADPGTDAFRENFGGGLSLGQIKDGADVVAGVNGLFDSGYSFGDAFTEISGNAGFFAWFTPENAAALDSTGSVMVLDDSDPYNMQIYYDHFQTVKEKREAGDD